MEMMEFREEWLDAQVDGLDVPQDELYMSDDAVEM